MNIRSLREKIHRILSRSGGERWNRPEWLSQHLAHETAALGPDAVRLHLGCGEVRLPGYVNIDAPATVRPVMSDCRPDVEADVRFLTYAPSSVDEVRLHHLFEHFDRPTAIRLLIEWRRWLKSGGRLVIETPDFEACSMAWLAAKDLAEKEKLIRHLFGSHEADWAVHREGWYKEKFKRYLAALGFDIVGFHHTEWQGTRNITVVARKGKVELSDADARAAACDLLRLNLVDSTASEERLLQTWLRLSNFSEEAGNK